MQGDFDQPHRPYSARTLRKAIEKIYRQEGDLRRTWTYQGLANADIMVGSLRYWWAGPWAVLGNAASCLSYHNTPAVLIKIAESFLPKNLRPSFRKLIEGAVGLSHLYQCYNDPIKQGLGYAFGLSGAFLANHVLNRYQPRWSEGNYRECEAAIYFCFRKAGWGAADAFAHGISLCREGVLQSLLDTCGLYPAESAGQPSLECTCAPVGGNAPVPAPIGIQSEWLPMATCINSLNFTKGDHANVNCAAFKGGIVHCPQSAFRSLYSNLSWLGGGGQSYVLQGKLSHSRQGRPKGETVALRCFGKSVYSSVMVPYARVGLLQGVTELYHDISSVFHVETSFHDLNERLSNKTWNFTCAEMEYVKGGFLENYHGVVPEAFFFEILFGEWAEASIAGICIDDYKLRHFMWATVPYARAYEIGRRIFLIDNQMSPRRIDYDHYDYVRPFSPSILRPRECNSFLQLEGMLPSLLSRTIDRNRLSSLLDYFKNHMITRQDLAKLMKERSVKVFKVPERYVPQELC